MARRRFTQGLLAAGALLAGTACTGIDQADAAGVGPADAVAVIAGQLAESAGATYTATYRLGDGGTATVARAQDPARTAYRWPAGRLIVTPADTTRCAARTCVITAKADPELPAASGLITPEAVAAMLRRAEADPALTISQRDTTIAERHAACIRWGGPSAFETCVTGDGTLAAFTGTLAGTRLEVTLTELTPTADPAGFQLPAGVEVLDQRTR
ncbi:hypothetical protein BJY16_002437 [Actinoplanes octamycinicus]|uniref:Lipoprotein n=1 Tax=Actinoplanes octamycinicus TaxID=135948 RepID=A0A7W7M6N2_9ACTN|nr:hypothetical protein [Actinoplanes octamycinicus]MBB4738978.1 hypothetical protein [Actinoplanes octamycinicus]GIE60107.1 hypothetical protein Aoc01nite_55090 [Actinoplanes octamycinicus]